ncbi:MAG TPA: tRNA pseudouridine(55) synthase TruB [Acidimicrobiia bacterium]|nr:tRNA pseudouridine(55) synthase TruB [Acidimicrobiia bacterium]
MSETAVGLLVVDKPRGITSHDVVAAARRVTGIRKIGHAGTLDPIATGVVVLALGRATRLIRYVQEQEKEYVALVQFGVATDTLDADGAETGRAPMRFDRQVLDDALVAFRGEIEQVPPMVSALKYEGKRLYEIARSGAEVDRQARLVTIRQLELNEFFPGEFPRAELHVICSKGTYIRTLADDIARSLGGRAQLLGLRRTRVGVFDLCRAVTIDNLASWASHLRDPVEAVSGLEEWRASEEEAMAVRHGRRLPSPSSRDGHWAVVDDEDRLLAVYRQRGREAVAEVVLA